MELRFFERDRGPVALNTIAENTRWDIEDGDTKLVVNSFYLILNVSRNRAE
ncbi:MAG: hypothetical protein Tsb009_11340 [Planctomycetaceae bacterium]